jgi:hypothetical protein
MPDSINPELLKYIIECRKLGFEDFEIRIPLLENGWELSVVQEAFDSIKKEEDKKLKTKKTSGQKTIYVYKNSMTIHLSESVFTTISKRAKRNMLTPEEQVEDIVRRSCVNTKKSDEIKDNVDDIFLKLFSRKNNGRPKTK